MFNKLKKWATGVLENIGLISKPNISSIILPDGTVQPIKYEANIEPKKDFIFFDYFKKRYNDLKRWFNRRPKKHFEVIETEFWHKSRPFKQSASITFETIEQINKSIDLEGVMKITKQLYKEYPQLESADADYYRIFYIYTDNNNNDITFISTNILEINEKIDELNENMFTKNKSLKESGFAIFIPDEIMKIKIKFYRS